MATTRKNPSPSKPGPKGRKAYSSAELDRGAVILHSQLDVVLSSPLSKSKMPARVLEPLLAAVRAYLDVVDIQRGKTWSLVLAAVALGRGEDADRVLALTEMVLQQKPARPPVLRAAIERKHRTQLGKAFAIYKIIAKGVVELPRRNAPEGDLLRLFREALSR